jgi:hypothetical protein
MCVPVQPGDSKPCCFVSPASCFVAMQHVQLFMLQLRHCSLSSSSARMCVKRCLEE